MGIEEDARAHRSVKAEPLAVAALALALAAFVMDCCCTYLGPVLSVISLLLGIVAVVKARGGASADMVIGASAIVASVVNLLIFVVLLVFYAGILMRGGGDIFPVLPEDHPPPTSDASAPLGTRGPLLPVADAGVAPTPSPDASAWAQAAAPDASPLDAGHSLPDAGASGHDDG